MITKEKSNSHQKTARVAGVLYLLVILFGVFAELYVSLRLIVPGDAAATARNITASEFLFRIGFMSGLLHHTCFFLLVLVFYKLLKPVHKHYAALILIFGLGAVPIMMLNMLNQFAALRLLSGVDYLRVFTTDQVQALALLFLDFHSHGYFIAGMFSGLFLLPLGILFYKSGYVPRFLGILLMAGCFGYLLELVIVFVFPNYEAISYLGLAVAIIAEFSLTIWLLLKGVKDKNEIR
jgi:hypothetical protein